MAGGCWSNGKQLFCVANRDLFVQDMAPFGRADWSNGKQLFCVANRNGQAAVLRGEPRSVRARTAAGEV
jgi:hypothetical protein